MTAAGFLVVLTVTTAGLVVVTRFKVDFVVGLKVILVVVGFTDDLVVVFLVELMVVVGCGLIVGGGLDVDGSSLDVVAAGFREVFVAGSVGRLRKELLAATGELRTNRATSLSCRLFPRLVKKLIANYYCN
jgi:hypothetical protein